jgi:hypothetical protein
MIRPASALIGGLVLTAVCSRVTARGDQDSVSSVRAHIIGTWELVSSHGVGVECTVETPGMDSGKSCSVASIRRQRIAHNAIVPTTGIRAML